MMSSEGAPEAKRQKVDPPTESGDANESADFNDSETQKALEDIDSIQNEIDGLNEKASEEILKVEQKYNKLRKPYFDKRNETIERIQNFWVTAFMNHPQISAILDQTEEDALQSLSKVEVEEFEDIKSGYKINFFFKSNPFFTNEVLCKEFHLAQTGDPESKSTPIEWKNGMDLTARNGAEMGNDRKRRLGRNSRNFFSWFLDNADPSADDIAEVIKDDMWPNPLQYYLAPDTEVGENGMDDYSDEDDVDESVVVVEDDDSEDDDEEVYEVEDDEDEELDTTGDVEVIEEEIEEEELLEEEEAGEDLDDSKDDLAGEEKDEEEDESKAV
ncbi:protein SET-like [Littorina saxatilis]|uniref:Protein SET n=1 Tax=Littorina saxatilis TaxID=31220 RepID=A0AAN9BBK5_9CAEN